MSSRGLTDQQVHFLDAVADRALHVLARPWSYEFTVEGRRITGRGLWSTFDSLDRRGFFDRVGAGLYRVSKAGSSAYAAFIAMPTCPDHLCARRVNTQPAATGDLGRRFYAKHKNQYGLVCDMSRKEVAS